MSQNQERRKVGTIRALKDGSWSVRVTRGARADGKARTACVRVEGTYRDAEAAAIRLASEMGRAVNAWSGLTLEQYYWGVFRDHPSASGTVRAPSTLEQYDGVFRRSIEPTLGQRGLSSLRHEDMKACILDSTAPRKTKVVLRAIMRSAYDDGLTNEKPFDRRIVTPPVTKQKQQEAWNAREAAEALDRFNGYPDPMIEAYVILGLSGLRCEEAMGVAPRDVHAVDYYDHDTGASGRSLVADVSQTYTKAGGVRQVAKNAFSHRSVPVIVQGRARLLRIMNASKPADPAEVEEWRNRRTVNLSHDQLVYRWNKACRDLGVRRIPPDMLRHTSETLMQAAGLQDTIVSRLHGHTELKTDYAHYMRPDAATAERAALAVHDLMPAVSGAGRQ